MLQQEFGIRLRCLVGPWQLFFSIVFFHFCKIFFWFSKKKNFWDFLKKIKIFFEKFFEKFFDIFFWNFFSFLSFLFLVVLQMSMVWQFRFHIKFHISRSGVRIPVKAVPCFQVWGSNPIQGSSTFPGLGFESHSSKLFMMWLQWQLIINQSITLFKNIFHGLAVAESKRKKSEKKISTGIRTPDLENVEFDVELELPHHAVEEKRESALWRPIVLRCIKLEFKRVNLEIHIHT